MTEAKPQNRRLGYARVSTYGQTLDAQLEQLRANGCAKIFRERVTGARADRRELLKLLKALGSGDVVTVTRIDRLARSTFDLFAIALLASARRAVEDDGGEAWFAMIDAITISAERFKFLAEVFESAVVRSMVAMVAYAGIEQKTAGRAP